MPKKSHKKKHVKTKSKKDKTKVSNHNIINIKIGGGKRNPKQNPNIKKGLLNPYSNIAIPLTTNRPQFLDPSSQTQRETVAAAVPTFAPVSHTPVSSTLSAIQTPMQTPIRTTTSTAPSSAASTVFFTTPTPTKPSTLPKPFHDPVKQEVFQDHTPLSGSSFDMSGINKVYEKAKSYDQIYNPMHVTPQKEPHKTTDDVETHLPSTATQNDFGSEAQMNVPDFKLNQEVVNKWETLTKAALTQGHPVRIKREKIRKQKRDSYHRTKDSKRIEELMNQGYL